MINILWYAYWYSFLPPFGLQLQESLDAGQIVALVTSIAAAVNVLVVAYQAWQKGKPEVKKMEAEGESEIVDAAHVNLEGAKISTEMLVNRIKELKADLEEEKKARKVDADYFRRRIKDIEREARDYRLWAARLAKQVIEVGKVPSPFLSSMNDSDPLITAITKEQEELAKAKSTRQAELGATQLPEEVRDDSK